MNFSRQHKIICFLKLKSDQRYQKHVQDNWEIIEWTNQLEAGVLSAPRAEDISSSVNGNEKSASFHHEVRISQTILKSHCVVKSQNIVMGTPSIGEHPRTENFTA